MRMEHRREFYIPDKAAAQDADGTDAAVFFYTTARGQPASIGFAGKAQKPAFHHTFQSEERRAKHLAEFIDGRRRTAASRAARKADAAKPHTYAVGNVLVSSWGYEQTNVDFYQVTAIIGPRTIEVRPIAKRSTDKSTGNSMADYVVAVPDSFTGEPTRHRTRYGNGISFESYRSASLWDGRPQYRSWYA
jgi:hypothetical protein